MMKMKISEFECRSKKRFFFFPFRLSPGFKCENCSAVLNRGICRAELAFRLMYWCFHCSCIWMSARILHKRKEYNVTLSQKSQEQK